MSSDKEISTRAILCWTVLGGLWGAWVGYQGSLGIKDNPDSFGSFFAHWFFVIFGFAGALVGMALSAFIGIAAKKLSRLLPMPNLPAVLATTLVCAVTLWQITALLQTRYPGLRAPAAEVRAGESINRPADHANAHTCKNPPPVDSKERASWQLECR